MAETHRVFGSCVVLEEVFADDLGHLYRAATVDDDGGARRIWLRVLDGAGLRHDAVLAALDAAREVGEAVSCAQHPSHPMFLAVDGVAALAGDFVPGQPLNRVLARARDEAFPLQPDNSLLIVERVALAIAAAEAVSVGGAPLVHGFLHPGLVLLSNDGEATVMGFGVGPALLAAIEDDDAMPGARAYLAPEVLATATPSRNGDVYSLGAILFHLLTGTALPAAPDDRGAALDAALAAWDGEPLAADIRGILDRALAPDPQQRYATASELRDALDRLIYGGAYSPTTFNLALFMDQLFRAEIERDETDAASELELDVAAVVGGVPDDEPPEPDGAELDEPMPEPEAMPPASADRGGRGLWYGFAAAVVVGVAAVLWWLGGGFGPRQPPPSPTPSAAEIAAQRRAQEERLRTMTQAMVAEMMAEREAEIRDELIARQNRIEELQQRLIQSERRAARSASDAAKEAETQKQLLQEIEEQEEAQRAQQDALDAERSAAIAQASQQTASAAADGAGSGPGDVDETPLGVGPDAAGDAAEPTAAPPPTREPSATVAPPPTAVPTAVRRARRGEFVSPEDVDTQPVVIKSQPLTWPRSAVRSKGKGVVVVQQTVNADGSVDDVTILRVDHDGWGIPDAALEAAKGYRYKPATKDGVAVTTHAFVTWRYDFTAP